MSQLPLHSSLPCICPRAAFHPHYRNSDGTFLPPPSLVLSFSAPFLPPIHMFLSVTLPSAICVSGLSCALHLSFLNSTFFFLPFILYFDPALALASFLTGEHILNNFSACVRASHLPRLWQNSGDPVRVSTVVVMSSESPSV